jgi:hypothetical protein
MPHIYSNPMRETDPHALPDVWVYQVTAEEVAESDEELVREYLRRFPLATMNSGERDRMVSAIVEEEEISGGWAWCYCLPGCLPDSGIMGVYPTAQEAIAAAQEVSALD